MKLLASVILVLASVTAVSAQAATDNDLGNISKECREAFHRSPAWATADQQSSTIHFYNKTECSITTWLKKSDGSWGSKQFRHPTLERTSHCENHNGSLVC